MVTTPTKPGFENGVALPRVQMPSWVTEGSSASFEDQLAPRELRPSGGDALQALLAFSAMHQQVRARRALASRQSGFEVLPAEFEAQEQFVLDEVLQLVAERAIAITGADGLAIALAENDEIVLRATSGVIKPDIGARIQRDSDFSGACFRNAQIIRCDDTETDDRVNLYACRQLGARSMVAVPLCGRRRVIGLLQAFSADPFGFNDSDVSSLELLAELIVAALKPEDEDRFAKSAQVAEEKLFAAAKPATAAAPVEQDSKDKVVVAPESATTQIKSASTSADLEREIAVSAPARAAKTVAPVDLKPAVAEAKAEGTPVEVTTKPALSSARHPGLLLVLGLVLVAALLGGGIWWTLRNTELGAAFRTTLLSTPTENANPLPATTAQSASPAANQSSQQNSSSSVEAPSNADASGEAETESATSQESSKATRITGIRHWSAADSSTVVLDLEDQVQYEAHRLANPDRIYFDLHDTSLDAELENKTIDIGDALLARVRVAQPVSGLTRLVLETKGDSNYSVSLEPNPYRLVVQVTKIGATPKAQINLFPGAADAEQKKLAIVVPPPTKEDLQLRARLPKLHIVVDAGHGGWDLGTVGRRGLLEKDLVLEIAQRLGKLLETRLGADVILTRNDDNYIPLDERAEIANQAQADLFVSVHANYSDLPSARGVETYYTNFFSSPNSKDLETRSNSGKNATAAALTSAELHDKIEQSRRLAASVQRSLYGTLSAENPGLRDRGVKEASYVVLTETAMPGILAEVSFVSSPTDEQKLRSDGYREQIAEALYKGIARYASGSRGVKVASAGK
jgi:N-acetylmuramoyl-L-alanine amidase/putative methionine-R-sulfoxide reductase with GAF domain